MVCYYFLKNIFHFLKILVVDLTVLNIPLAGLLYCWLQSLTKTDLLRRLLDHTWSSPKMEQISELELRGLVLQFLFVAVFFVNYWGDGRIQ